MSSICLIPVSAHFQVSNGNVCRYEPEFQQVESSLLTDLLLKGFGIEPDTIMMQSQDK